MKLNSENATHQLAIKNTQQQPTIENIRKKDISRCISIYVFGKKNTKTSMKTANNFFKIEKPSGDIFWKGTPIEKMADKRIQFSEDDFDISKDIQNVLIDTTDNSVRKMNETDEVKYENILKSPFCKNYKPTPGEPISRR